eukprot:4621853-Pyramimonas_sp.AAC.1
MNKGHIYGPVIHFGVFEKFFAVQGVAFALPLRADIDAAHLDVATQGPTSCSAEIAAFARTGDLPHLGLPTLYKARIPRTPTRRPAPRTP